MYLFKAPRGVMTPENHRGNQFGPSGQKNIDLQNETFEKFKTYYDCGDKALVEKLKKDCELFCKAN